MKKAFIPQFLASLPMMINFVMANCNGSWLANAIYFLTQPGHVPSATVVQCGLMETCFHVGRFISAIPSGIWVDKYGTKHIIISIGCIQVVTWVCLSMFSSVWVIFVVRFLQGLAAALTNTTGGNTIGELCSPEYRGTFIVIYKIFGTLGSIIEGLLATVFSSYKVNVYTTMAMSFFFLFTVPWITETPYYLVSASKYEKSKCVLEKLRVGNSDDEISAEYESIKQTIERIKLTRSRSNWLHYLTLKSIRGPLIHCILMNSLIMVNGTSIIALYATVIFPPNKFLPNNAYPLILSLIQFFSSMGTVVLIDALPRRHLFILCGFLAFLMQSINGFACHKYLTIDDEIQRNTWQWIFLVGTVIFWILSNAVLGPLNIILRSELLPLSIRGLGNSICMICQSISVILSYQIFSFIRMYYGIAGNYVIFAINSLLMILIVYFLIPETRGKTLAEVENINYSKETVSQIDKKAQSDDDGDA